MNVVELKERVKSSSKSTAATTASGSESAMPAHRSGEGWRAGKPAEDPEKMKRWGLVAARPSEFLIHMRRGRVVEKSSGQGASCFKWPWDPVAIVPTTVQRLRFTADQVTSEKVGVHVTGLAVYRIAEPLIAFRMLNFSFPERASEKLEDMLVEMFVGAARRLVANLTVEQCLTQRKEGIATELMQEISPVVSGAGRTDDRTSKGWGVVIDTIEIQDVRVSSQAVFTNLQARYRQEQERAARDAELATQKAVQHGQAEAERQIALTRLAAESEVNHGRRAASEQTQREQLAGEARIAEEKVSHERQIGLARMEAEVERARLETESAAAQHGARIAAAHAEREMVIAQREIAQQQQALLETQLILTRLQAERDIAANEAELKKGRAQRDIENAISPEAIQWMLAKSLPQVAQAFQQKMGQVNITAFEGANPFAYLGAAVESVLGIARSAGLKLPGPRNEQTSQAPDPARR